MKRISLSWLVVSTRHYIKEYDWYINSDNGYCYACSKVEEKGSLYRYAEVVSDKSFVLMPELQDYSIEHAAEILRNWCVTNGIQFNEDLDNYKSVERGYWGYDDFDVL